MTTHCRQKSDESRPPVLPINVDPSDLKMNYAGRLLRVLVIDDSLNQFKHELLDVVEVDKPDSQEPVYQIMTWQHAMHLLTTGSVPQFDLLLIDIAFEKDETAPPYGQGNALPPYGLIIATVLAGMRSNIKFPFEFEFFSTKIDGFLKDSVSILCFGLLRSTDRTISPHDLDQPNADILDMVRNKMNHEVVKSPSLTLESILPRYRTSLVDFVRAAKLYVKPDSIKVAKSVMNSHDLNPIEIAEQARLDFSSEDINLRSLFADRSDQVWKREAMEFLEKIENANVTQNEIYESAVECEEVLRRDVREEEDEDLRKTLPEVLEDHCRTDRNLVSLCLFVFAWLRRKFEQRDIKVDNIGSDLGWYRHAPKQLGRILDRAKVHEYTLGGYKPSNFCRALENNPQVFRADIKAICKRYCEEVLGWTIDLPECLTSK